MACRRCERQYDVGRRKPGAKVRCFCGKLMIVPEPEVRQAVMQRCASCGGRLKDGARRCDYCSSEVTLGERGWGDACPSCLARLVKDAKFCSTCGTEISPVEIRQTEGDEACPQCDVAMSMCESDGVTWIECTSCGGVWLEEATFQRVVDDRLDKGRVAAALSDGPGAPKPLVSGKTKTRTYRNCPVCLKLMNRKGYGRGASAIVVDTCKEHGIWFDPDELERLLDFVESGGLQKVHERSAMEARIRREGMFMAMRTYGTFLGDSTP